VDINFRIGRQQFVWDSDKAAANIKKHRISFAHAAEALVDPYVEFLQAEVENESREAAIGMTRSMRLLYVVNVERDAGIIRIVSAREATAQERHTYENRD
jgi:uncharacterized DUF497 family protein